MLYAVTALLVCQIIGEGIVQSTGLPLPGPLVGMMLLFTGLVFRGRVPAALDQTSSKLFRHMMLFFTPIVVGVMMHVDHVAAEWLPFLAACIVGSAVTLVVTGLSLQWMLKRRRAAGQ